MIKIITITFNIMDIISGSLVFKAAKTKYDIIINSCFDYYF